MALFITDPAVHSNGGEHCCFAPISITQCCYVGCPRCAPRPPASPDRLPFEAWAAQGAIPPGVTAQDISVAFIKAHHGKQPPRLWAKGRGPRKPCFSAEELLRSLAALPPQPPPAAAPVFALRALWWEACGRLPSSGRYLWRRHGELAWLEEAEDATLYATIRVTPHLLSLARQEERALRDALQETLFAAVQTVVIRGAGE